MSRTLGAETVGLYQIALNVIFMLLTLSSGAPTVLSRKIAEAHGAGDERKQNSLTVASLIIGFVFSSLLVILIYALRNHLGFLFSDERCLPIFLIMLPTLITSTLYASLRSWFWGRKKFLAFSSTELFDEVVKIILSAVFAGGLVTFISGANGIALAMTLSDALCVVLLAVLFFISGGRLTKPTGFKELIRRTVPLSATRIITSVSASLAALIIPKMLVMSGLPVSEATAEFGRVAGMALPLIMAPMTFVSSLSVVLIPDVAFLKSRGDVRTIRQKLSSAMTFAILISALFFIMYLPLGKSLGKILFGDEKAGALVSNCSLLLFPVAISQATTPMLNSLGKEKVTLISTLAGTLSMLPCIFFLPKFIGVYAMAVASFVCFSIIAVVNCVTLKKEVGDFADIKKFLKTVGFAVPLALIGLFSARLLNAVAGDVVTVIVLSVFLFFFSFVCVTAFQIADISVYLKLLRPTFTQSVKRKSAKRKKVIHPRRGR